MKINSNEPTGLTKREYFAALALQGINAGFYSDGDVMATTSRFCKEQNVNPADYFANMAVEQADALIKALNKDNGIKTNLVAAAPELLFALIKFTQACNKGNIEMLAPEYGLAMDAIAKAHGNG